ncbi:MAG: hypothetical protein RML94_00215 [Bacteroidia bacterium]|nr:hypothetical protein [Bacteroidia bacterium]
MKKRSWLEGFMGLFSCPESVLEESIQTIRTLEKEEGEDYIGKYVHFIKAEWKEWDFQTADFNEGNVKKWTDKFVEVRGEYSKTAGEVKVKRGRDVYKYINPQKEMKKCYLMIGRAGIAYEVYNEQLKRYERIFFEGLERLDVYTIAMETIIKNSSLKLLKNNIDVWEREVILDRRIGVEVAKILKTEMPIFDSKRLKEAVRNRLKQKEDLDDATREAYKLLLKHKIKYR